MRQPLLEAFGAITPEQQARIEADVARLARLRAAAGVVLLGREEKHPEAVECRKCKYLGNTLDTGGWCMALKMMVATWHPRLCGLFRVSQ